MANILDFGSRYKKGLSNPFSSKGQYCITCKMEVDVITFSAHRGTTYVYRKQCKRCGNIIERGASDCISVLGVSQDAIRWTSETGEDRR